MTKANRPRWSRVTSAGIFTVPAKGGRLEGYWFEDATAKGGKVGHLHRDLLSAKGHAVPHKPLPKGFPR